MWFLRLMGNLSLKKKMENEDVLKNLKTEKTLLTTLIKSKATEKFRPHHSTRLNNEQDLRRPGKGKKLSGASISRSSQGDSCW